MSKTRRPMLMAMSSRLIPAALVVAIVLCLATGGGALIKASGSSDGVKRQACLTSVHGKESRIKPGSSGYSCSEVQAVLSVLPSAVGLWPIKSSSSNHDLTCRIFPPRYLPLEIRCWQSGRQFEVVEIPVAES